jgi:hypothetical protein
MEVATPSRSMSSSVLAGFHSINGRCPVFRALMAAMKPGDEKWL